MTRALPALALAFALALASPGVAKDKAASAAPRSAHNATARHGKGQEKPADPEADTPSSTAEQVHVVKPGETLGGIARRARVPRVLIAEANHLPRPWTVRVGQKLKLPRTRHHTVEAGETGFDIAYQYGVPFNAIAVANGLSAKAVLKPGQDLLIPTILAPKPDSAAPADAVKGGDDAKGDDKPAPAKAKKPAANFVWPLDGKLRRGFTPRTSRSYHDGIDIAASPDAAVRATETGTVIFAGREPKSFGNLVVIQHNDGWQSAYGFLGRITVGKGDTVRRRERIGLVGHSGKATRDELHFELRKDNQPVDPVDLLPPHGN